LNKKKRKLSLLKTSQLTNLR